MTGLEATDPIDPVLAWVWDLSVGDALLYLFALVASLWAVYFVLLAIEIFGVRVPGKDSSDRGRPWKRSGS